MQENLSLLEEISKFVSLECNDPQFLKIADNIGRLFEKHRNELDDSWCNDFKDHAKIVARLLELVTVEKFSGVGLKRWPHTKVERAPDFTFSLTGQGQKFALEVTSVKPQEKESEIKKVTALSKKNESLREQGKKSNLPLLYNSNDERSGDMGRLVCEHKSRLISALKAKLDRYFEILKQQKCGMIVFVSFSEIPFYASVDMFHLVDGLYGCGNFKYIINYSSQKIVDKSYEEQTTFYKLTSEKVELSNNFFLCKDNALISAVILSRVDPVCALIDSNNYESTILVHNPCAQYPLQRKSLPVSTEIWLEGTEIKWTGKRIHPDY